MNVEKGSWNPPGRTLEWRVGMLVTGMFLVGLGVLVVLWPQIIVWTIASVFLLLGLFLIVSSALARGGGDAPPPGVFVDAGGEDTEA